MTATADVLPEGWMGHKSRKWLEKRARKAKRIIEVGSWLGRSTSVLAKHCPGTVWAVDSWMGTPGDADQHALYADTIATVDPYNVFCVNMAKQIAAGKVIPLRAFSVAGAAQLGAKHGNTFDMVFIDADHSYEGARGDIAAYRQLLVPNGLLCGHDYHWPGVKRAVDECAFPNLKLGPKSIWAVRL